MSKKITEGEKIDALRMVTRGVETQFEGYSWDDMIDDLDMTERETKYAKENLCYRVYDMNENVKREELITEALSAAIDRLRLNNIEKSEEKTITLIERALFVVRL